MMGDMLEMKVMMEDMMAKMESQLKEMNTKLEIHMFVYKHILKSSNYYNSHNINYMKYHFSINYKLNVL